MLQSKQYLKENYIFGLDIGTRSIVGIVGYPLKKGLSIVADYVYEHDTRAVIDGQIYDVEKVTESVKKVKYQLEKQLGFTLNKVCIAAAGRVLKTKMIHVEQEVDANTTIDDDRIFALELLGIEKAHQEINENLKGYESGFYCIGYTVSKYYLNKYEISKLQGNKGKLIGADVLATFLPKEVVESLHYVISNAGLEVSSLTLEPIAAINVAIPYEYRLLNIALVDIGAGTSDIAITKDGNIIAYGMIPFAGDETTETLLPEYLVDFKTAEFIKIKASSKSKTISYKNIMGIKHKINVEDVNAKIRPSVEKLADGICNKIKELNNNTSTNAVFIVGGGGQLTQFTDILAEKLNIPGERVAIRSSTALNDVYFESEIKKSPELVTPIGICLSGLEHNKRDFMKVYFNDEPIKVYDTNNLSVMDIAAYKGINPKDIISKKGEDLSFILNGFKKTIRGEPGEPAKILINNKISSLNDRVQMNDYIVIIPAKKGNDATISTKQLIEELDLLHIQINNVHYQYKPKLKLNNNLININYEISQNDEIETVFPTIKELFNQFKIEYSNQKIIRNNEEISLNTVVSDNDIIFFENLVIGNSNNTNTSDNQPISISVIVNNQKIVLDTKREYTFVDIFEKYPFDLSKPKGIVKCEINNELVTYMSPIKNGDILKVYWSES